MNVFSCSIPFWLCCHLVSYVYFLLIISLCGCHQYSSSIDYNIFLYCILQIKSFLWTFQAQHSTIFTNFTRNGFVGFMCSTASNRSIFLCLRHFKWIDHKTIGAAGAYRNDFIVQFFYTEKYTRFECWTLRKTTSRHFNTRKNALKFKP